MQGSGRDRVRVGASVRIYSAVLVIVYLPERCVECLLITKFIHHSFLSLNLELIALALRATMRRQHSAAQCHVIAAAWRHRPQAKLRMVARARLNNVWSFPSRLLIVPVTTNQPS